ncbi:gamma-glutamyl kinase [Pontivivens ytuae]|uniref:Gamma-glutamyl kinase n=1 Tax=Pontivivens ytuae TaxID=2789856 RepID=A0A7S9QCA2_9RHOB|nr:gamma-glutamyl kinase [Pontivivens ytuae]QPH53615.1 gamma-glutamyl kinase [Pontivivens ytuae]
MIVSFRARLAVLALPKTGTTALESVLAPRADIAMTGDPKFKHMRLRRFERDIRPMLNASGFEDIETLAVIREPVEWLGSWYRYRTRPVLLGTPRSTAAISFDAFVEAYLSNDPPVFARVGRPSRFLEPTPSGRGITHLMRYDRPKVLLDFLSDRFGCTVAPAQENVSPSLPLELSPDLRRRLELEMAPDFELYEGA